MIVLAAAKATTTRDDDPGRTELGSFALGEFAPNQFREAEVSTGGKGFDRGAATLGGDRVKAGGAHGDDLDRVVAFDRGECIARIDRAHEGIGGFDLDDVGDLRDIEQRRNPRHDVLAAGRGRGKDVAVAWGNDDDQRGEVLRQLRIVVRSVGLQHLGDPGDLRRLRRGFGTAAARHQQVDLATDLCRRGDCVEGCAFE